MTVDILRSYFSKGITGRLFINGAFQCYTLEFPLPYSGHIASFIPEGNYLLTNEWNIKPGQHLNITGAGFRALIIMHSALQQMYPDRNCIIPTTSLLKTTGLLGESERALDKINSLILPALQQQLVTLTIKKDEHEFT